MKTPMMASLLLFLVASTCVAAPLQKATFAGGCFWCVEEAFDKIEGVTSTVSGFSGGSLKNPSYKQVSSGKTQHIESVQVTFDPDKVSYNTLLYHFWQNVDPTVKNRQFCDVGAHYRSAIFVHTPEQKRLSQKSKAGVMSLLPRVHTEILDYTGFYPAEEYHQNYYKKNLVRYKFYKWNCGRKQRLEKIWTPIRIQKLKKFHH